jgi:hypothetical protein
LSNLKVLTALPFVKMSSKKDGHFYEGILSDCIILYYISCKSVPHDTKKIFLLISLRPIIKELVLLKSATKMSTLLVSCMLSRPYIQETMLDQLYKEQNIF